MFSSAIKIIISGFEIGELNNLRHGLDRNDWEKKYFLEFLIATLACNKCLHLNMLN